VRRDLNGAARRIAAAFGLAVAFRETLEAGSGRLEVAWTLKDPAGQSWRLALSCRPSYGPLLGWCGAVMLIDGQGVERTGVLLVDPVQGLGGRRACPQARERFCSWAGKLAPGSRVAPSAPAPA
jgi:hypothetical protein